MVFIDLVAEGVQAGVPPVECLMVACPALGVIAPCGALAQKPGDVFRVTHRAGLRDGLSGESGLCGVHCWHANQVCFLFF